MCKFALVGAATDASDLRRILSGRDWELDTDSVPTTLAVQCFPQTDAVLCVTTGGCSCSLLEGIGVAAGAKREMHFAGPGYVFRRALAAATLRFGGIRVLAYDRSTARPTAEAPSRRTTTLGQFLRSGLQVGDGVVCILA